MIRCHELFLTAACLLLLGCNDGGKDAKAENQAPPVTKAEKAEEPVKEEPSYLGPIEVGMKYQYLMMVSGSGMPVRRYDITYHIKEMEEVKGKTYFKTHVDTGGNPMKDNFVEYDRIGEDGYYMIEDEDETQTEYLIFPKPIPTEKGASWTVQRPGEEPEPCTILGFETITIFGVTYEDCLKIKRESEMATMTGWLAKGVGGVKFVQDFEQGVLVFLRRPAEDEEKTADGEVPPAVED